jgi:hypothetical protein
MNYDALNEIERLIRDDPELSEEKKKAIAEKIQEARTPMETDKWIYRIVVGALGMAILSCLIFSFVLMLCHEKGDSTQGEIKIPEIFMAIGSAAVGALAGLLAPSPASRFQS